MSPSFNDFVHCILLLYIRGYFIYIITEKAISNQNQLAFYCDVKLSSVFLALSLFFLKKKLKRNEMITLLLVNS